MNAVSPQVKHSPFNKCTAIIQIQLCNWFKFQAHSGWFHNNKAEMKRKCYFGFNE